MDFWYKIGPACGLGLVRVNGKVLRGREGGDGADVKFEDDLIKDSRDFPHI